MPQVEGREIKRRQSSCIFPPTRTAFGVLPHPFLQPRPTGCLLARGPPHETSTEAAGQRTGARREKNSPPQKLERTRAWPSAPGRARTSAEARPTRAARGNPSARSAWTWRTLSTGRPPGDPRGRTRAFLNRTPLRGEHLREELPAPTSGLTWATEHYEITATEWMVPLASATARPFATGRPPRTPRVVHGRGDCSSTSPTPPDGRSDDRGPGDRESPRTISACTTS